MPPRFLRVVHGCPRRLRAGRGLAGPVVWGDCPFLEEPEAFDRTSEDFLSTLD